MCMEVKTCKEVMDELSTMCAWKRVEFSLQSISIHAQRPTGLRRPIWAENPILIAGTVRFAEQDWHSM